MKLVEICFLVLFAVVLLFSILFATILGMGDVALALFLLDFPIAAIVAFYASLSIREEEEEKTQAPT